MYESGKFRWLDTVPLALSLHSSIRENRLMGRQQCSRLSCAFDPFGLFSVEMGQKFPNHSAVHLQLLSARNGRLTPYFSSKDHQCSLFTLITTAGSEEAGVNGVVGLRETNRVRARS